MVRVERDLWTTVVAGVSPGWQRLPTLLGPDQSGQDQSGLDQSGLDQSGTRSR